MALLRQILYFSHQVDTIAPDDLVDIYSVAREQNELFDISGVLLHADPYFIQFIEGPVDPIGQLITNIRADARNINVTTMLDQVGSERVFPDWTMGFRSISFRDVCKMAGLVEIRAPEDVTQLSHKGETILNVMSRFFSPNEVKSIA